MVAGCCGNSPQELSKEEVIGAMEKSADWHMKNMDVSSNGKVYDSTEMPSREWHTAAYYDGMIALSRVSGNPKYWGEVLYHGTSAGWTPNPPTPKYIYHADDHAVGHAWLDTYRADTSRKERLAPMKELFENIIEKSKNYKVDNSVKRKYHGQFPKNTWTWCDALFMAPPTLARLYKITGDRAFLDYMNSEYKYCYDTLFSQEDDLFYRDEKYIGKYTVNGKKIFWSRGNGWVVGGLVQILQTLDKNDECRKFYEDLFVRMMKKIADAQGEDGLWSVNLADSQEIKGGETSGSGFFNYALTWGVNNGYLDSKNYRHKAIKAWRGLLTRVKHNGMVGYVQPVGASPDSFNADTKHAYGVGVFLLAGSEIAKMLNIDVKSNDSELLKSAQESFDAKTVKAFVHIEPRRKDDIAWENDTMAFRVYGPALKDSVENSGIDVWAKRVPYSVIMKWYEDDFAKRRSYHKDYGEGCDMYKVADSVGLGGTGIWKNGKLYQSNVYQGANIIWQSDRSVKLVLRYYYDVEGKKFTEFKTIKLGLGDKACKVQSQFFRGHVEKAQVWYKKANEIEVAVGILAQSKDAKITISKTDIVIDDNMEGKCNITQFVKLATPMLSVQKIPFGKTQQVLSILKTDKEGKIFYEFGYKL